MEIKHSLNEIKARLDSIESGILPRFDVLVNMLSGIDKYKEWPEWIPWEHPKTKEPMAKYLWECHHKDKRTFRDRIKKGIIRTIRDGGRKFYNKADLLQYPIRYAAWLKSNGH